MEINSIHVWNLQTFIFHAVNMNLTLHVAVDVMAGSPSTFQVTAAVISDRSSRCATAAVSEAHVFFMEAIRSFSCELNAPVRGRRY